MPYLNHVMLLGHLGKDPELRHTPNGSAVCNFSLATSEKYKDKSGEWQEKTEWHNIVVWGPSAEKAAEWLHKGSTCMVIGKITTRTYKTKDGDERRVTEIVASDWKSFEKRDKPRTAAQEIKQGGSGFDDMESDLPF